MRVLVPLASFLATWVFFYEYLPPLKRMHFFADIEGYHYPLLNYAHRALRTGDLPQWDSSIYSGYTFIGNTQVGLFYPPNWLLFYLNRHRDGMKYFTLEALLVLHVWIGFVCCWLWLRKRARGELPAILGAGVYAFSGFALGEAQHYGANCGYAWFPLALIGLDEFASSGEWRKLWKVTATSALTFLAGYTSAWVAFCIFTAVYAAAQVPWRRLPAVAAAFLCSIPLFAVQLVPAMEAASLKLHEPVYGNGIGGGIMFYLEYFLPNYYDQSHRSGQLGLVHEQYMYLGAIAIVAMAALAYRGKWNEWRLVTVMGICGILCTVNPGRIVEAVIGRTPFIWEVVREWSFLPAICLAAALATAHGAGVLRGIQPLQNVWMARAAAIAALGWCGRQLWLWKHDGVGFATGWWTLAETGVTAVLLFALLRAAPRWWVTAALLITVFVEYKVYGTSRRFNALPGDADRFWANDRRLGGKEFRGVLPRVYEEMRNNPDCRVALLAGQHSTDMRHYQLNTPQGFDPFLPDRYRQYVERFTPFETNRTFQVDWKQSAMLDALAVRYLLVPAKDPLVRELEADPRLRLMARDPAFFLVFEYLSAKPSVRFDAGTLQRVSWTPDRRVVRVESEHGGEMQFIEQAYPGWRALVDGEPVPIELYQGVFQSIRVPPGKHSVEFRFSSPGLRWASYVTILSLAAFLFLAGNKPRKPVEI
ncbi:MAG: YfhO family protein [Acidobacteria bacterium]|nr:YfhO family protein [Acidobacteriota bacterium]